MAAKIVSVIIPTYNYARYISQALESLLNQSYPSWECIIIDDGSTDNTKEIVGRFQKKDNRINYFLQKNAGPTLARNRGIGKAKGDYILFLDADDILEENKIASHLKVFEDNPGADIVYGDVRYFTDGKENELFYSMKPIDKPWLLKFTGKGSAIVDIVLKQNIMASSSPVIKKYVLEKIGSFDTKIKKLEDWELFQRMALNDFTFHFTDAPKSLVLIRLHSSSFSFDQTSMRKYLLPILENHFIKSKLSFKNHVYVIVRIVEEYTDLILSSITNTAYLPRHYYKSYSFILPIIALLFLPFYLFIKVFRMLQTKN